MMSKFSFQTLLKIVFIMQAWIFTLSISIKKMCSNSGSHYICSINAINLLAGVSEITVYLQDLLHTLCGFLSKGRLWPYRKMVGYV